jgi:hypothetical protein
MAILKEAKQISIDKIIEQGSFGWNKCGTRK